MRYNAQSTVVRLSSRSHTWPCVFCLLPLLDSGTAHDDVQATVGRTAVKLVIISRTCQRANTKTTMRFSPVYRRQSANSKRNPFPGHGRLCLSRDRDVVRCMPWALRTNTLCLHRQDAVTRPSQALMPPSKRRIIPCERMGRVSHAACERKLCGTTHDGHVPLEHPLAPTASPPNRHVKLMETRPRVIHCCTVRELNRRPASEASNS